jgi:hypothetical protein
LSGDGNVLAVGAFGEDEYTGAVYVFVRDDMAVWSEQAHLKASNPDILDYFGYEVALSADGKTLAVGALGEASSATGINGDQDDNSVNGAGATYVFVRDGMDVWSQQAYVKASNTDGNDFFGGRLALSGDGNVLAVGVPFEQSKAKGIDGNDADNSAHHSGAVYVFVRSGNGIWSQQAYVKASNADAWDHFGFSVALSNDGQTLAVGACWEASNATGINGNQADNSVTRAGAVYVFAKSGSGWWQQAYVKASSFGADAFGQELTLSGDGNTLAVGAPAEASNATGIGGNQADNSRSRAGAVYLFVRNDDSVWSQQAYVKASNPGKNAVFGSAVALSGDGQTMAVSASGEASNATGIGGDQTDSSAPATGAVYLY